MSVAEGLNTATNIPRILLAAGTALADPEAAAQGPWFETPLDPHAAWEGLVDFPEAPSPVADILDFTFPPAAGCCAHAGSVLPCFCASCTHALPLLLLYNP